jgi:hypothetical protein
VRTLHVGESAVRDLADRPWHCGQRCNGHRERCRANGRPTPGALPKPPGQTITTVSGERIKDEPAFTVVDLLQESPGVSFKQGNGPRDIGIGSRAAVSDT